MVERDLKKRAKLLEELRAKWAKPHPKPVKRKVQDNYKEIFGEHLCP
ncbi:MAG: hypothetical protein ACREDV_02240 [Methylocella sp.]